MSDHSSFVSMAISASVIYTGAAGVTCTVGIVPTPTPRPTATPGGSATATPFPTPTLSPQAALRDSSRDIVSGVGFADPSQRIRDELQGAVNAFENVKKAINDFQAEFETAIDKTAFVIKNYSPFKMFRGALVLMQEFEWIAILAGWFVIAFFIIIAIEIMRFIVSFWGVVERIIQVIKLIPFI
jgi:hypothetical protein